MKKILIAACLILSAAAFAQKTVNNNNDHGQNDCQCIGIGIQVHDKDLMKTFPGLLPISQTLNKEESNSLWYTYLKIYMDQRSVSTHAPVWRKAKASDKYHLAF